MVKKSTVGVWGFCLPCIILGVLFFFNSFYANAIEKKNNDSPTDVFLVFHEALYKRNITTVKQSLSKEYLTKAEKFGLGSDDELLNSITEIFTQDIKVIDEKIEGDKAIVTIIGKFKSSQPVAYEREGGVMKPKFVIEKKGTINMVKEDGGWKIESYGWRWPI
jgi:hypothetical protein